MGLAREVKDEPLNLDVPEELTALKSPIKLDHAFEEEMSALEDSLSLDPSLAESTPAAGGPAIQPISPSRETSTSEDSATTDLSNSQSL